MEKVPHLRVYAANTSTSSGARTDARTGARIGARTDAMNLVAESMLLTCHD